MFPDRYDRAIAAAVERWWPDYRSPTAWKAQLWQESRLDSNAVSPAGAEGVAQFMPATWVEVTRRLGWGKAISPRFAEPAIEAGAFHMAELRRQWRRGGRTPSDKNTLAQASYNAGLGNILAAQRRCAGPDGREAIVWTEISPCLPSITGRHSIETTTYVTRIAHWRRMMEAGR